MKKSHAFILTLFLGIISAFANDAAPNCSLHSSPDDAAFPGNLEYVKRCRSVAGCMFKFNTPTGKEDYKGECVDFVASDCSSYDNAVDCYKDPQCNFNNNKSCTNNEKCSKSGEKLCNKHNDTNGTPCQLNARKKCNLNTGGAKPNIPASVQ